MEKLAVYSHKLNKKLGEASAKKSYYNQDVSVTTPYILFARVNNYKIWIVCFLCMQKQLQLLIVN